MLDLHSHTFFSDGKLSPAQLIDLAVKRNIKYLAITDHDTCQGLNEALAYAEDKPIKIIPGIEIEVNFSPGDFHLLGLNLKSWEEDLQQKMSLIHQKREERNLRLIGLMQEDGIPIRYADVQAQAEGNIIARPHFAAAMIQLGIVKTVKEAFDKYLGPGKTWYTAKEALSLEEAIDLVISSGGKPVLAHPLSLYISWGKMADYLTEWKEMGLQGIEAWHSGARIIQAERFTALADKLGLFVTGGSDYHGKNTMGRELGLGPGKLPLKESLIEAIL